MPVGFLPYKGKYLFLLFGYHLVYFKNELQGILGIVQMLFYCLFQCIDIRGNDRINDRLMFFYTFAVAIVRLIDICTCCIGKGLQLLKNFHSLLVA